MPWVIIDDAFMGNPKWEHAPCDSIAMWVAALAWCNANERWDGRIPSRTLAGLVLARNPKRTIADLEERRAIHPDGHDHVIHDFAEWQRVDKKKAISEARREAGRKGGQQTQQNRRGGEQTASNCLSNSSSRQTDRPTTLVKSSSTDGLLTHSPPPSSSVDNQRIVDIAHAWAVYLASMMPSFRTTREAWISGTAANKLTEARDRIERVAHLDDDTAVAVLMGIVAPPHAWYANPDCQACEGSGVAPDEDNRFGPCACRRAEPYTPLATVHQLREDHIA